MSKLVEFYNASGEPFDINDIIDNWNNNEWEKCHGFIQWVFPTDKQSLYNPDAPIITLDDIYVFQTNDQIRETYLLAIHRFMEFLGVRYNLTTGEIKILNLQRFTTVTTIGNHNNLRITRFLESAMLLGFSSIAIKFVDFLYINKHSGMSASSIMYWLKAVV